MKQFLGVRSFDIIGWDALISIVIFISHDVCFSDIYYSFLRCALKYVSGALHTSQIGLFAEYFSFCQGEWLGQTLLKRYLS